MSLHKVLESLSLSNKGKLSYCKARSPSADIHNIPTQKSDVFDLSSLKHCLELCEDEAFVAEEQYNGPNDVKLPESPKETESSQRVSPISWEKHTNPVASIEEMDIMSNRLQQFRLQQKAREFEEHHKETLRIAEEKRQHLEQVNKIKEKQRKQALLNEHKKEQESANLIKQENLEKQKLFSNKLKTKLQEAEKRKQLKIQVGKERYEKSLPIFQQCTDCYKTTAVVLHNQNYVSFVQDVKVKSLQESMEELWSQLEGLSQHCQKHRSMEKEHLEMLSNIHQQFLQLSQAIVNTIETIKMDKQKAEAEKEKQLQLQLQQDEIRKQQEKKEHQKELNKNNPEFSCPPLPKELQLSVSASAYYRHQELLKLVHKYEEITKTLNAAKEHQKLILGMTKAISVPISSITSRSGSDIKSKLSDLNGLLSGQSMKFGNQSVTIKSHPEAVNYAYFFMAKKFVKQAEGQVSSNHSAAFSLSLTLIGVWAKHSVVGELVIGQMQTKCPFIIPWYVPKREGQTDTEYSKSRGYLCAQDGSVEGQDKYLKRMSGFVRTYAALIQSPLPPSVRQHPHGIEEGWKWLARMLNLDPWPEVTATVLYDFLDVAGHAMMSAYGRQFKKLLYSLCHDYFPKIKEVSAGTGGGPLQRLERFLSDCMKTGRIPKPEGYLGSDFWNTYHHAGVVGS